MSGPDLLDEAAPPQPKPRRRRLRWLVVAGLLLVGAIAGILFTLIDPSEQELLEAIAEADRIDPGWRFEDLEARRKVIPDEENAALRVLAARQLMPAVWPTGVPTAKKGAFIYLVNEAISRLPPPVQLDDVVARKLAAELANVEAALVEARKLKGLSEGRYPAALQVNGFYWGEVPALHRSREIATLLEWEAAALAHAGRTGESLATGRAVLVAARAFGDEPVLTSFIFRMAGQSQALRSIERTLAQGVPPSDELRATQELLEDEAARPLLLAALRGERAMHHRLFDTGYVVQSVPASKGGVGKLLDVGASRRTRHLWAEVLHAKTACIELAKLPVEEQASAFAPLMPAGQSIDKLGFASWGPDSCVKMAMNYRVSQASLRGTIVGLALERYRAEKGCWPDRLDELVPAHLKAVPRDPFGGQPMHYKQLGDGVLVYSVGPDERDDGGALNRMTITAPGTDLGFRLWDVEKRRQPPAEVLPLPVSSK